MPSTPKPTRIVLILGLALLLVLLLSLFVGRYPTPGLLSPAALAQDELAQQLVLNLRLPRVLTACLLGMSLGAAGAVLQMIFRNPLVEPGFLGLSQGAALGAAFAIIFLGRAPALIQGSAALCAGLGLVCSYTLAQRIRYGGWVLRLVLAGIVVSALFSAGVGLLKYLADPLTQLPDIVFWTLGGLGGITWPNLVAILPVVAISLIILFLMRWRLNLLSLSDEAAVALGATPGRERALLLGAAVAATAAVVSVAGVVAWLGLIVPHVARRWLGADAQRSLPAAILLGGLLAVVCDDLARTLLPGEIPLGILTALIGALVFIVLMVSRTTEQVR